MTSDNRCPRCAGQLRTWNEMNDEERQVAIRLPAAEHAAEERKLRHRWCTRCWFEDTGDAPTLV